jgi:hypothetical protein
VCQLASEGGRRCSGHTREPAMTVLQQTKYPLSKQDSSLVVDFASTSAGQKELTEMRDGAPNLEKVAFLTAALKQGVTIRAAWSETTAKAKGLRKEAAEAERLAADSFERSDTDGALSQWASGLTAQRKRLEADIADKGGKWSFPVLTGADGNIVPARVVNTRYGAKWAVFGSAEEANADSGEVQQWVTLSDKALRKRGLTLRYQLRDAKVDMVGDNVVNVRPVIQPASWRFDPDGPLIPAAEMGNF